MSESPSISLDQLIAVSDEIAALARAGVPLERGLLQLGKDFPGSMARISKDLAERMQAGESLSDAMRGGRQRFPPAFRAVVEAGLRTGRLAPALEDLATLARRLAELRSAAGLAMLYPMFLLVLACGLSALFTAFVAPQLLTTFQVLRVPSPAPLEWLAAAGDSAHIWAPAVASTLIAAALVWWWASGHAASLRPDWAARCFGWIPRYRRLGRYGQAAAMADLLALLLEHGVPAHEALVLAAEVAGSARTLEVVRGAAAALERGDVTWQQLAAETRLPPGIALLLCHRFNERGLVPSLRHMAGAYRLRAATLVEGMQLVLPVVLTVVVGGAVTLTYCLALFVPLRQLLQGL